MNPKTIFSAERLVHALKKDQRLFLVRCSKLRYTVYEAEYSPVDGVQLWPFGYVLEPFVGKMREEDLSLSLGASEVYIKQKLEIALRKAHEYIEASKSLPRSEPPEMKAKIEIL